MEQGSTEPTAAIEVPRPAIAELVRRRPLAVLRTLGPGLIAGASDNDPTTVATLAVIGASTAYGLAWLVALVIPMLVVVQVVAAAVGVCARQGLAAAVRARFGRGWAVAALLAVLAVNLVTLAADLEGGAAALGLLTGLPDRWFALPFAAATGALLVWGNYGALQRWLRWVLLTFLAYVAAAFLARPAWGDVLRHTAIPHFTWSAPYITGAIALLGTTLTSYAYVWETIEEAEERPPLRRLGLVQLDAGAGMVLAGALCWFIVIATGATLGATGADVQTAQDAAAALAPAAGRYASLLFGVGLLASAVLAVPVLAGTSAYALAEVCGWRASLDAPFARARPFYAAVLASLGIGAAITFLGVGPIRLLFVSSIAGGLATPFTLALLLRLASDPAAMRGKRIGRGLAAAGWAVVAVVTAAAAAFLWQTLRG
jgi:Mn2+/Fe2+ NRAMP family transporter